MVGGVRGVVEVVPPEGKVVAWVVESWGSHGGGGGSIECGGGDGADVRKYSVRNKQGRGVRNIVVGGGGSGVEE